MQFSFLKIWGTKFAILFLVLFFGSAHAQTSPYPNKPIKIIIPFPPGNTTDLMARLIAPRLSERLGQQVIVENRPGAGGSMGSASVSKSAPDGYTLLIVNTVPHTASAGIYPRRQSRSGRNG